MDFAEASAHCGIIAILRGITPGEVEPVAEALFAAGIRIAEIPLNSPDPFTSIARMSVCAAGRLVVGAGTVLTPADVDRLKASGGSLSVSPDCNPATIARAVELGLVPVPGVFTPSEAFTALRAGARHLKLFPAEAANPATIKAWKAVLPREVAIYAVGGITPATMASWRQAGAAGFGIGSNLYKPGFTAADVKSNASAFVAAWNDAGRN
jgi:2-dehydro-3-deoxyphosphogalactonate aldolase